MLIVAAIGGNAILRKNEKPSVRGQMHNMKKFSRQIVSIARKHHLVLTHGNGPQVGNELIRVEEALGKAYPLPLYACVAESQGEIGFMMEQSLQNALRKHKVKKSVATLLTQVLVDKKDPMFRKPTKFVGPYYTKKEAENLQKKGFSMKPDPRGGYRRVVPSPRPIKIVEADTVMKLVKNNIIPIAAGGGGIPVYNAGRELRGIDAVIDKDMASACLAKSIRADVLLILTDVPCVYLNYRKANEKKIKKIKSSGLKRLMKHFPAGSMGPKIEAALDFVEHGGRMAVITNPSNASQALSGKAGTIITK